MENIKINQTKNYDLFNLLNENREIKEAKVAKILKSIEKGLNLLPYCPILVDELFYILDGQHRFEAAKRSNNFIYFIIVPNLHIKDVAEMNSNSDKWTLVDFITSYATGGNENYIKLLKVADKYKGTSLTVLSAIFSESGDRDGGANSRNLSSGNYKFSDSTLNHKIISHYNQIVEIHPKFKSMPSLRATVLIMREIKNYDTTRMIDKMIMYKKQRELTSYYAVKDILRSLEDVYNLFTKKDIVYFTQLAKEAK